jgi:hypothetical protein
MVFHLRKITEFRTFPEHLRNVPQMLLRSRREPQAAVEATPRSMG